MRRRLLSSWVIGLLACGTLLTSYASWRYEHTHARDQAVARATSASAVARLELTSALGGLRDVRGLFDSSRHVSAREFATFGRGVVGRGGLGGVAWWPRVARAGERDSFPLAYIATTLGGDTPRGTDAASEPTRRRTLRAAARDGRATITTPVALFGDGRTGLVIYQPVYAGEGVPRTPVGRERRLAGFVSGAYRLDALMGSITAGLPPGTPLEVRDGRTSITGPADLGGEGASVALPVAGRVWTISVAGPAPGRTLPVVFLAAGALLTLLVAVLALVVSRRQRFADDAVAVATEALRASRERYQVLIRSMPDGVVVQDEGGAIVACNPAAERTLGLSKDQLMGRASIDPRWRTVHEDGSPWPGERHPAMTTLATGEPQAGVIMGVRRSDGELRWLSVSCERVDDDGGNAVVSCFADVTSRREAEREQAALRRVAMLVASEAEPRRVFDGIAEEASALVGGVAGDIVRFGEPPSDPPPVSLVPDGATDRISAPIRVDGVPWGEITVALARDASRPRDAEGRLERLGELASLAIVSADARAQLAALAATDHLTGLWNRRAFHERIDAQVERARRHGRPLALVLFDIDHFKLVNDTHGHPAGDRVLIEVARRLFGAVRDGEVVARIGGEEFAWILPDTDAAEAMAAAERLRAAIAVEPFPGAGRLTVSLGVADLEEAADAAELFRLADGALYRAKSAGRDRVVRHRAAAMGPRLAMSMDT